LKQASISAGFQVVAGLVAVGLAGCAPLAQKEPAARQLPEARAIEARGYHLPGFHVSEIQQRRFSSEMTFTNAERVVKIEVVPELDREGAQTLLNDSVMGVQALYANALSPYPGDISRQVVSDRRFRPELVRTNWGSGARQYMLLFANDRLGYGAVTDDVVKYRSLLGWIYCEGAGTFYKVRYFGPLDARREEFENFFRSLACPQDR
jgi:hypothetical protein